MFSIAHLNALRGFEIDAVVPRFRPGSRVLELGAGTGRQALEIRQRGFDIEAVELPAGRYDQDRLFPIIDYDGRVLPFPDQSFDIVFSSNVLEHVRDLPALHAEIIRVLRPGGYCIHILPTDAWRFWTTLSAFAAPLQEIGALRDNRPTDHYKKFFLKRWASYARASAQYLVAPMSQERHGERGNVLTELWYFRPGWWRAHFKRHGFEIMRDWPGGLFYTGNMVMNTRWPISFRRKAARWLGSACHTFEIRPAGGAAGAVEREKSVA